MTTAITALAEHARSTVHDLAIATRPAITTMSIAEFYATTGALADLAAALAQVLGQLATDLPPNENGTTSAATRLRQARAAALGLNTLIDAAHQTLGDHAETTRNQPEGSIFNRR